MISRLGAAVIAAGFLLEPPPLYAQYSPHAVENILVLPLSEEGFAVAQESREMTRRLGEALGRIPGLALVPEVRRASCVGTDSVDFHACSDVAGCLDTTAAFCGASHVLTGSFGRSGARSYLLLELRDARGRSDITLETRDWRSSAQSQAALEAVSHEVARRLGKPAARLSRIDLSPDARAGSRKKTEKRDVRLAMTLGLLPAGGFIYLERYDLAAAYFVPEIAGALGTVYLLGRSQHFGSVLVGGLSAYVKYAEIIHTGREAQRQNRAGGFALQILPSAVAGQTTTPIRGVYAQYSRRF